MLPPSKPWPLVSGLALRPKVTPARVSSGPTLLTGICFCAECGGAMTLRTGKIQSLQILHLLLQGPAGCDWLQGQVHPHDQTRYPGGRLSGRPAVTARPAGESPGGRSPTAARSGLNAAKTTWPIFTAEPARRRLASSAFTTPSSRGSPTWTIPHSRTASPVSRLSEIRLRPRPTFHPSHPGAGSAITPAMLTRFASVARSRMRLEGGGSA